MRGLAIASRPRPRSLFTTTTLEPNSGFQSSPRPYALYVHRSPMVRSAEVYLWVEHVASGCIAHSPHSDGYLSLLHTKFPITFHMSLDFPFSNAILLNYLCSGRMSRDTTFDCSSFSCSSMKFRRSSGLEYPLHMRSTHTRFS